MGDLFDVKYYQSAVDAYQFLCTNTPPRISASKAMLPLRGLERKIFTIRPSPRKHTNNSFSFHPHSERAAEVRAALEKLNNENCAREPCPQPVKAKQSPDRGDPEIRCDRQDSAYNGHPAGIARRNPPARGAVPQVSRVRT